MHKIKRGMTITVEYSLYITLAVAFLLIPTHLILSWVCAVFVHELGHYITLRMLKVPIISITLSVRGIKMETGNVLPREELLSAAAGPLCSVLLLLTRDYLPFIAFCGMVQGGVNLVPILPLDGGRILRSFIDLHMPGEGDRISKFISKSFGMALLLCGVLLFFVFLLRLLSL